MSDLGVGLVFMPALLPLLREAGGAVSVIEIEPQMLWRLARTGGRQDYLLNRERFDEIAGLPQRKLLHSVSMPVGGTLTPDPRQASLVGAMAAEIDSPWISEHLSFNAFESGAGSHFAGFFLPPRQTNAGVAVAAANIRQLRTLVQRPIAVETGVNYLRPCAGEIPDGEFFAAVAGAADCGLVVDLHNLWANELNGRQSTADALALLPPERVWEVHVAGGMRFGEFWLDSHSDTVPEAVLQLAAEWIPRWPNCRAVVFEILEEHIPRVGLEAIARQIERLNGLRDHCAGLVQRPCAGLRAPLPVSLPAITAAERTDLAGYENWLGRLVLEGGRDLGAVNAAQEDPGVQALRTLVADARKGFIALGLHHTMLLLLIHLRPHEMDGLFRDYLCAFPAEAYVSAECDGFARFLRERALDLPYLRETLDFEHALVRATLYGEDCDVTFGHDPAALFDAIQSGVVPASLPEKRSTVLVRVGDLATTP